ncbi:MAG TPA: hypothetical protein VIW69_04950 [Candidatus Elarobacter sp.]
MSRSTRRDKAEGELEHLEARFRERLNLALRTCAAGQWGLFGQNDAAYKRAFGRNAVRVIPAEVGQLLELGDEIDALRSSLGFSGGNALYARLKSYRKLPAGNASTEPRLARQLLAELEADGVHEAS